MKWFARGGGVIFNVHGGKTSFRHRRRDCDDCIAKDKEFVIMADIGTFLPDEAFLLDVHADDWKDAIRLAGQGLVNAGFTTDAYTDEMIATVEKMGPYIVIAPGLALAHSRPSDAVKSTGLSWVRLSDPVEFGNKANDPVSLVIGLAGRDENEHITVMSAIAAALVKPEKREQLANAKDATEIRATLEG
ncbi:PTS sugar transporter subunit IIA [Bifidobacterium pseudolongum]|nr:PTS sugar transporter subunit IIA [Bifidobacterium pseudolongum]